jgi:hypothetical protein
MRFNPYGESPQANPRDVRQAMNRNDPRQRGLLGAAWNFAYFAHFARTGAEAIALGGLTGPFGLVQAKANWPQPWFDRNKDSVFPVFHILRGVARLKGADLFDTTVSRPRDVQALAARRKDRRYELWIANLTADPVTVDLGAIFEGGRAAILDAERFAKAAARPEFLDKVNAMAGNGRISLDAFAVARVVSP